MKKKKDEKSNFIDMIGLKPMDWSLLSDIYIYIYIWFQIPYLTTKGCINVFFFYKNNLPIKLTETYLFIIINTIIDSEEQMVTC